MRCCCDDASDGLEGAGAVQRGRLGGYVFRGYVKKISSTMYLGGGRMGGKGRRKHTPNLGS